ncbi:GTP-binding protein [Paenarthrobacter sp. YAF11_1]|uniref:CobW family GTP-binding protein n=1 Tax=Paenarthrobacter sp. YAF11_1 TaxID=3233074 RepID=UPI003F998336
MIDVTVVGGFLGAGKTTWLSRILEDAAATQAAESLAVVVNDYASVGVDDWLLDSASSQAKAVGTRLVAGGCVCCDKKDELIACLISIVGTTHRTGQEGGAAISHVYIETSGVADPRSIVEVITEHPVLQANLLFKELVVIVDGINGTSQLRHQELARAQVGCADRVVLSKLDLAQSDAVGPLSVLVRQLNPAAELRVSRDGRESALTPSQVAMAQMAGAVETAPHWDQESFSPEAWTVQLSPEVCWAEYALWLDAVTRTHPQHILRSKGTIHTPNGPIVLQSVGGVIAQPRPVPPSERPADSELTSMVFIIQGIDRNLLARSLESFVPSASTDRAPLTAEPNELLFSGPVRQVQSYPTGR